MDQLSAANHPVLANVVRNHESEREIIMMPTSITLTHFELPKTTQYSPELHRMEMLARARREETDALIYGRYSRMSITPGPSMYRRQDPSLITKTIDGIRNGIGTVLIFMGNRIHTTA